MKRFEYLIEHRRYAMTIEQLNAYGDVGWELASAHGQPDSAFTTYIFKKEVIA